MRRRHWGLGGLFLGAATAVCPAPPDAALGSIPVVSLTVPEAETPSADEPVALPTLTVTARRREELADAVPVSVTVVEGADLQQRGLRSPEDLQSQIVGLTVNPSNPRQTTYAIRGLGSSGGNEGLEGSVGVFVDGVYLGRQGLSSFDLFDIEQIEALRGPQGTLFGKNTTAGALHVRTAAPTFISSGEVELGAGSEDFRLLRGYINGAIADSSRWAGRLSGYATDNGGTVDNLTDGGTLLGKQHQGARGQLLYDSPSGWRNRSSLEWARARDECCLFLLTIYRPGIQARDDYMEYAREPANPFARKVQLDSRTELEQDLLSISNEWTGPLGAGWDLSSLSAWRSWDFVPFNDDGMALDVSPLNGTINAHQQFSQEFRASGDWAGLRVTGGVYLLTQQFDGRDRFFFGDEFLSWVLGGALRQTSGQDLTRSNADFGLSAAGAAIEGSNNQTLFEQRADSAAAFSSIEWPFAEQWEASLGLRYTYEDKQATIDRVRVARDQAQAAELDDPLSLDDGFFTTLGVTDPGTLTLNVLLDQIIGGEVHRRNEYSEGLWSGQASVSRELAGDQRVYLSLARGAKSGGINLAPTGGSVNPIFKPETISSAELGIKGRWLGGQLAGSAALYAALVRDYQALTFDSEPTAFPNPRPVNLINVGRVSLQGLELELRSRPASWLSVHANAAYTRAITEDFDNAADEDARTNTKDLSGEPLYNAPRWSTVLGIEVDQLLTTHWHASAGVDWSYRSETFGTVERGRGSEIDGYSLIDLRASLHQLSHDLRIDALLRNALDEDYLTAVGSAYGVGDYGATVGVPRRIEIRLSRRF